MLKRTITGFFIILFIAGFTALRQVHELFFDAFALILMYGAIVEMCLANKFINKRVEKVVLFIYPVILACIYIFSNSVALALLLQLAALLLMFAVLMTKELIRNAIVRKKENVQLDSDEVKNNILEEAKNTLQILVYPTSLIGFLMGINHFGLEIGYVGIILVFAISMFTDVFAYCFGCLIKGAKMAPEISPKKSIAGMIFGALGGMIAAGLGYLFFVHFGWLGDVFSSLHWSIPIIMFVIFGVLGTFLTQFGDLVASAFKRKVGIKDFGSIFPGHGGFMDRIDGQMFTAALIYIVFGIFMFI